MAYRISAKWGTALAFTVALGSSIAHAQSAPPSTASPSGSPPTTNAGASPDTAVQGAPAPTAATPPPSSGTSLPPAGTSTAVGTPPSAQEAAAIQASAAYNVKLRDMERKVNELKEQVFRSKARLNLLKEAVLHGVIAGARSAITFKNEMSGMYVPVKYVFSLDGAEVFTKSDDSGKLGDQKEIDIYDGSITPGNHTLSVQLIYQGNAYGVFSYLKGYKFTARSSHTFTATDGKQTQIKIVGYEKGNSVTTDPKDRPAVEFREAIGDDKTPGKDGAAKPADSNAATPAPTGK